MIESKQVLIVFSSPNELFEQIDSIDKNSTFYIDSNLGQELKGEKIALELYRKGFTNLFMTTGYNSDDFKELKFIKGVKDKSPPWK